MKTINKLEQEAKQSLEDAILQLSFAAKEMILLMQNISQKMIEISEQMKQFQSTSMCITSNKVSGDGSGDALPEVSQEERDSDGWIDWGGGDCPVQSFEKVEVMFKGQTIENKIDFAGKLRWQYHSNPWTVFSRNIIAYRIVK